MLDRDFDHDIDKEVVNNNDKFNNSFYMPFDSADKQISDNMSSNQIAEILDHLLFKSLRPIFFNSNLVELSLASIVNSIYTDHRRKLSSIDREELLCKIYKILATSNKKTKWRWVKELKLERSIWSQTISLYLNKTKYYTIIEDRYIRINNNLSKKKTKLNMKMIAIEQSLKSSRKYLSSDIKKVEYNFNLYNKFRDTIIKCYIRFAYTQAIKSASNTSLQIDENDLYKNLVLSIGRAIDKYDPDKGTLTSYINFWFMNAKTNPEFDHEYGKSYNVSITKRRKITNEYNSGQYSDTNLSVSIEDVANEDDFVIDIEKELIDKLENNYRLAIINKARKPANITHLLIGIPYILSEKEKSLLLAKSVNQ